jgi:hypothetical protein
MKARTLLLITCVLGLLRGPLPAATLNPVDDEKPQLEDLYFMEGVWQRKQGADFLEETWSGPRRGSLVGMLRWLTGNNQVKLFELMTVTQEGDDVIFRLRHFSNDLVPWEEKKTPLVYKLVSCGGDEAVFESETYSQPKRFIYRCADENQLMVRLESEGPNGKLTGETEFHFTRQQAP